MDNMKIYNAVRKVPQEALKSIQAGRLKGKSDINPMWRLKALTEQFGPVGFGWKYTIDEQWLETGANNEISAFVNISLYVKMDGEWSEAIPGTGGSAFVASERNGLYTSDECYKMALTDAISVACKALGFAADVYWDKDRSKYQPREENGPQSRQTPQNVTKADKPGWRNPPETDAPITCANCGKRIGDFWDGVTLIKAADIGMRSVEKNGKCLCGKCANV